MISIFKSDLRDIMSHKKGRLLKIYATSLNLISTTSVEREAEQPPKQQQPSGHQF